jgi:hypothetical protein
MQVQVQVQQVLLEDQETSLADFEVDLPLTEVRFLSGEYISKEKRAPSTLTEIAREWAEIRSDDNGKPKRVSSARTEMVQVKGVGAVSVLKLNNYSLQGGEPSVMERELKGKLPQGWGAVEKSEKVSHVCVMCIVCMYVRICIVCVCIIYALCVLLLVCIVHDCMDMSC